MAEDCQPIQRILLQPLWDYENPLLFVARDDEAPRPGGEGEWDDPLAQMIDRAPHWIPAGGGASATQHPNFVINNKLSLTTWLRSAETTVVGLT